jgi:hypothetical protein
MRAIKGEFRQAKGRNHYTETNKMKKISRGREDSSCYINGSKFHRRNRPVRKGA